MQAKYDIILGKHPQMSKVCGGNPMLKTYSECLEEFGYDGAICNKLANKALFRVYRGLYSNHPYASWLEICAKRYPKALVSMESSFFYWGLTDRNPEKMHLTTDRDAAKITDTRIAQHFVPAGLLELGAVVRSYNGVEFRTYDLERTAIDLVRAQKKLDFDLYKEVIQSLRQRVSELYPAKIDDYLEFFPYKKSLKAAIEKEIF